MIGKGHRLSAHTLSKAYKERHPLPFFVFPGYSDILLPALVSRASGCITGTGASHLLVLWISSRVHPERQNCIGNLIPKTIVKLYTTAVSALQTGDIAELEAARNLQDLGSFTNPSSNHETHKFEQWLKPIGQS
jgi:hypothetical protein